MIEGKMCDGSEIGSNDQSYDPSHLSFDHHTRPFLPTSTAANGGERQRNGNGQVNGQVTEREGDGP
jgi:hypothetical protein